MWTDHVLGSDAPGAAEFRQVDDEGGRDNLSTRAADQFDRRLGGATGGDEVVDQEDACARGNGILVDLDRIDAVFEAVVLANGPPRQLALLADRDEAAPEFMGDGAAQDETAGLDAHDEIDPRGQERQHQPVDRGAQAHRIGDQRGDVAELDARLRVIGNRADQRTQVDTLGSHRFSPRVAHRWRRRML